MSLATAQDADVTEGGVFGQTMGLVAATLGFLTLGAYLGRHLSGGPSIVCFILGFLCLIGLNYARGASGAALGLLFATGLFLGLGLGGGLAAYASADPGVVWQSAAATALFVGGLGALGYAVQSDLSGGYRVLFLLLLALIAYGLVTLFVSIPAGNVVYAVLGLGDLRRIRRAGLQPPATGGRGRRPLHRGGDLP